MFPVLEEVSGTPQGFAKVVSECVWAGTKVTHSELTPSVCSPKTKLPLVPFPLPNNLWEVELLMACLLEWVL